MKLKGLDYESSPDAVQRAVDFFMGKDGRDAFLNLEAYNRHAAVYASFDSVLNGLFDGFARKMLAGLPVPKLVEDYFCELTAPVVEYAPQIAGFSLLYSQQLTFALAMTQPFKQTGMQTLLGGATLSVMPRPESLLSRPVSVAVGKETTEVDLTRILDGLVIGEGEAGLAALADGAEFRDVPGLVWNDGTIVRANPPSMIENLHTLPPPDFDDLPLRDYHSPEPVLPYLSARGCFWGRCAFCTHQKTYFAYREEPVEQTAANLAALAQRYGTRTFSLVDEMIHPRRFRALAGALVRNGTDIRYAAYAKPTRSFSRECFDELYASGARVVMWGVESGNAEILDLMGKGTDSETMETVLRAARDAGIRNLVFVLFGFPSETAAQWDETLSFLPRNADAVQALSKSRFLLLEGSHMLSEPERFHITRVMDRPGRDLVSIAWDYETDRGLTQDEVRTRFEAQSPELARYGISPHFGRFRDHLLIHAALGK